MALSSCHSSLSLVSSAYASEFQSLSSVSSLPNPESLLSRIAQLDGRLENVSARAQKVLGERDKLAGEAAGALARNYLALESLSRAANVAAPAVPNPFDPLLDGGQTGSRHELAGKL
ncbi:hypothetical protein TeGR_g9696, partial [Tetraparma gracilis]